MALVENAVLNEVVMNRHSGGGDSKAFISSAQVLSAEAGMVSSVASEEDVQKLAEMQQVVEEKLAERQEQAKRRNGERELVWRKGLELKVELERLKRVKDATEKEIKDAEKKHRTDCFLARKEYLSIEQKIKMYREAIESAQGKREQQKLQQQEELDLAAAKLKSLKAELQELKATRADMEAEKKKHLASCKTARRLVLQLQNEMEDLKKEVDEGSVERGKQTEESQLVQAAIARLQEEKAALLKQKETTDDPAVERQKLEEEAQLAAKVKLQLQHEIAELKLFVSEQEIAQEREQQRHLRKCKMARREAMKLQKELQELKDKRQDCEKAMEDLTRKHASEESLTQVMIDKLREDVDAARLAVASQASQGSPNSGFNNQSASSSPIFPRVGSSGSLQSIWASASADGTLGRSPATDATSTFSRQPSMVDPLDVLLAEEEFQRLMSDMPQKDMREVEES